MHCCQRLPLQYLAHNFVLRPSTSLSQKRASHEVSKSTEISTILPSQNSAHSPKFVSLNSVLLHPVRLPWVHEEDILAVLLQLLHPSSLFSVNSPLTKSSFKCFLFGFLFPQCETAPDWMFRPRSFRLIPQDISFRWMRPSGRSILSQSNRRRHPFLAAVSS